MKHLNDCGYDRQKGIESFDFENLSKPLPKIWTPLEMKQFEQGLNEFGKDFSKIKLLYLPDKPIQSIVEYYYNIWKTTETYIEKREEKTTEKKKKIKEITEPQSVQLLSLNLNSQEEKCSSQNNSFESNEELNEKNVSTLTPRALCSSCLKYKNRISFNRYTNSSILNSTCSTFLSGPGKANSNNEYLERPQLISHAQTNPLNDRKNNNLSILKQYETTLNSSGTTNLFDARVSLNKPQNPVSIYNDAQGLVPQLNVKQETLCNQCWIYWKKYGSLKFNYHENNSSKCRLLFQDYH
jgi:hypothetical protein